jgi:crotonobetainyl-CoA:carnitine CoA-transferase CaiB-like acyl-CoA transferase
LCEGVLGRSELCDDPRYSDNPSRVKNRQALDGELRAFFAELARDDAIARLEAQQIAWSRVSSVGDLAAHPALRRINVSLPNGEVFSVPCPAGRKGLEPTDIPALGAHTAAIRAEFS